jgi:osmoprotectant transport system substrate-binding protein
VGAQAFTEQAILAQMLRQLIEERTDLAARVVECGDTYGCGQALRGGTIGLMAQYTGTGLAYAGFPTGTVAGESLEEVRRQYGPMGYRWLDPLGFDNGFLLVMPTHKAKALGVETIAHLARLEDGIRIAAPAYYQRRPVDGLFSLLRRYGLRLRGKLRTIDDPAERVGQFLADRADVAVMRNTDGILRNLAVTRLEDVLHFFPPYVAAIIIRKDVIEDHPELRDTLALLTGRITTRQMQQLNFRVDVEGWTPETVAREFLEADKLLVGERRSRQRRPEILVAVDEGEYFKGLMALVLRVVREVFPDYTVRLKASDKPAAALASGQARLAVLGAEGFFHDRGGERFASRDDRIEAVAVLGNRPLHIVRRANEGRVRDPLSGRVGVPSRELGRVPMAVLEASGKQAATTATVDALLTQVVRGDLDGALVPATAGDPRLAQALSGERLVLHPLPTLPPTTLPPFLRPAVIPAGTYAGQDEPLETLATQFVLADAAPPATEGLRAGGPAAALNVQAAHLSLEEANEFVRVLGDSEPPDPVLPSVWLRRLVDRGEGRGGIAGAALRDTLLNVLAILFLGWLSVLVVRR